MRRILSLILVVVLLFPLCACGDTKKENVKEVVVEISEKPKETTKAPKEEKTENMVSNGDFSQGIGKWTTFFQGGDAKLGVNPEGQMEVKVLKMGSVDYGVQAYLDGFALVQGCKYKISFDVSSSISRDIEWRIQINGGDYHPYVSDILQLTSEMKHFEKTFLMQEASDPVPRLCFNMGVRNEIKDEGEHVILIDNIELVLTDDSNKADTATISNKPNINVNQIGYQKNGVKAAVFRGKNIDKTFEIVDISTGKSVFSGTVSESVENPNTGEINATGDFTEFKMPGKYKITANNCGESYEFLVEDNIYNEVLNDVFKMLYMQRCGEELPKQYAKEFAHTICHDQEATVFGTQNKIDVTGGWHDAGDYGRYVVSGAKSVADLLLAYQDSPASFTDNMNTSDSGNNVADILDEARFELEWMFKMQDVKSGGVYHKVTCSNFPGTVMPQDEKEELIVAPVSTCATGDFAAVMAMASRIYKDVDLDFADQCLKASKKAMAYMYVNENGGGFKNPKGIVTGEYGDSNDTDERFWALAELFKTTGEQSYQDELKKIEVSGVPGGLGWMDVGGYGMYAYLTTKNTDSSYKEKVEEAFNKAIEKVISNASTDGYYSSLGQEYVWGSNMLIANNGMMLIMADKLNKDARNLELAQKQLDYLFGQNGNSYCFVTGYGTLSPTGTHHRPSQNLKKTMSGMLVGGPNADLQDPYAQATLQGVPRAKCYVDNEQSYSCNEVTVYWNSPLIYLVSELSQIQ